jgi:hypothetical protein
MRRVSGFSTGIFLLFLIISICSVVFIIPDSALAQPCRIEFTKSAPGGGDTEFPFEATLDGGQPIPGFLSDGQESGVNFAASAILVELPIEGWNLDDISCTGEGLGFNFDTENAVQLLCLVPGSTGSCTFTNVGGSGSRSIPTLSEWGMIAAAAGLGLVGMFFVLKRRRAAV